MGSDLCAGIERCIGNYYGIVSNVIFYYGSTLRWVGPHINKITWIYNESMWDDSSSRLNWYRCVDG